MRAILVGASGFLVFWVLYSIAQRALLGPDRFDFYPTPTLTIWYARWLLTMATAALLAAIPTGLLMWGMWRVLARALR